MSGRLLLNYTIFMDEVNMNGTAPTASKNVAMGVLSYLGPLVIVSYLTAKDDPFVKFHIKQGLVLLVIEVAVWIVGMVIWIIFPILMLINLATIILSIVGIINAVKGEEKKLPLVGDFAKHFNF